MLASGGADVALLDLNAEKLCGAEKEARQYAGRTVALPCDISREAEVYAAVSKAEAALGHIDILVNNAAVWRCWDAFVNVSAEEWRKFIDVNLMGTVYCTRAVLPGMLERRYGKIVNVASVAGVYGNANMAHYSATKGAVISLTYALAKEVAVSTASLPGALVQRKTRIWITFRKAGSPTWAGRALTTRTPT